MEQQKQALIPRLMTCDEIMLIYGINYFDLRRLLNAGRLLSIEVEEPLGNNNRGRRIIYDPAWSLSYGGSLISTEHAHVFRTSEVAILINVTPRSVRWYSQQRIMGYKKVGKHRMYSMLNIREVLAWRERHDKGKTNTGARGWMLEWARKELAKPPNHPMKKTMPFDEALYPTVPMPRATL